MKLRPTVLTATCILGGLVALVFHAILTFGSALGAGLGATQNDQVPKLANWLWAASMIGVPVIGIFLTVMVIRYRMIWWRLYATGWVFVLACLWAGSWVNADGYPSNADWWPLLDVILAAITIGSGWYALHLYPREYFEKLEADKESIGESPGMG